MGKAVTKIFKMSLSAELHGQKDTSRIKQEPDLSSVLCFKRKRLVLSGLL